MRDAVAIAASAVFSFSVSASAQTISPASSDSGSVTLLSVLRAVKNDHPLVVAAEARVLAARARRATAGAFANPVLTYQIENAAFPGRDRPAGLVQETSTFASLPLEQLWQRNSRVGIAGDELAAAEAELVATRRGIALDAGRAFHRVALAQFSVDATSEVLVGLDSLTRYTRARVREGATAEGDLLRLEVERDRIATDRALQESELVQARAGLQPYLVLAGSTVAQRIRLDTLRVARDGTRADSVAGRIGQPATVGATMPSPLGLSEFALSMRPDVLAARARVRAAGTDIGLQRAMTIRQIGAVFGSKNTGGSASMIAGISLPLPLFDQNRGEIQRARADRIAAEQELRWTELRGVAEVAGAYEAARILTARTDALQSGFLARADASRTVALAAYREGAVPLLAVLDATRTLVDARLSYLRARYAQQDAVLALYVAAGLDPYEALPTAPATRTAP